jgi:hypothetical protein
MTTELQKINSAIIAGNWTNADLDVLVQAVKFARQRLSTQIKRSISIGDNVNFTSTKTGRNTTGFVTKVAIKYVTVQTINGLWRVPANMLTKVEDHETA